MKKGIILLLLTIGIIISSCYPRCPLKSCHTRKIHTHGGKTFRGNPWYFKQNPGIGESDNPLIRTKKHQSEPDNNPTHQKQP
jgi:hypothetical protein